MPTRRSFLAAGAAALAAPSYSQSAPSRIRVAQIGTQHAHAGGKMTSVRGLPDLYDVLAVADVEPSDSQIYAGLKRLPVDDLLALDGLQAVLVETQLERSCPMALKAIRAGKHVHLDKPGAVDHAEFTAMRQEAEKRGLTVQMGYMLRYNPAFVALVEAMKQGWLGEILEIDAMMGKLADPGTRKKIGELQGGGMFELACHLVDAVVTLLGKPRAVHSFSSPTKDDGVKDNQLAVLEYPRATVTLRCNHADPFGGPRRRFQVSGTKGNIEIMPLESGQFIARFSEACGPYKKGEQKLALDVPKDRYMGEFQDLAAIVRGEKKLAWDAAHDIAVHETVLRTAGMLK